MGLVVSGEWSGVYCVDIGQAWCSVWCLC